MEQGSDIRCQKSEVEEQNDTDRRARFACRDVWRVKSCGGGLGQRSAVGCQMSEVEDLRSEVGGVKN